MVYRSAKSRETKRLYTRQSSTLADKLRRHKNKKRIWRRCVAQLELARITIVSTDAATLEPVS